MGPLPMFTHSFLGAGQEAAQVRAQELVATDAWQEAWRAQRGDGDPSQGIFVKVPPPPPHLGLTVELHIAFTALFTDIVNCLRALEATSRRNNLKDHLNMQWSKRNQQPNTT